MATAKPSKDQAKETAAKVREYFAALTPESRKALKAIREAIRAAAPEATEGFSYGIPGFKLDGKVLIWYAAWKQHTSIYPITPAIAKKFAAELKRFETSKGTIRFPMTQPPPVSFLKRLVKTRVAELRSAAK
jgi:uncharacterized protein YdhG (YjbR/CyaY superfamily)